MLATGIKTLLLVALAAAEQYRDPALKEAPRPQDALNLCATACSGGKIGLSVSSRSDGTREYVCGCEGVWCGPIVAGKESDQDFRDNMLAVHNEYRKLHNVSELTYDEKLEEIGQEYMDGFVKENCGGGFCPHNADRGNVGENLYFISAQGKDSSLAKAVVQAWYNEIFQFNFSMPYTPQGAGDPVLQTGHFVQVVWPDTTAVGCARGVDKHGTCVVICNYEGSVMQHASTLKYIKAVPPRTDDCDSTACTCPKTDSKASVSWW